MRNMYNVIGMIILVVSAALGIVFTVAMDAVSAGSGAQIVLMVLILASMGRCNILRDAQITYSCSSILFGMHPHGGVCPTPKLSIPIITNTKGLSH